MRRRTAIVALVAGLVTVGPGTAAAAEPGDVGTSQARTEADGVFYTAGDWVHVTNGRASTTRWRSEVDVDLVGSADSPEKGYTEARSLPCGA